MLQLLSRALDCFGYAGKWFSLLVLVRLLANLRVKASVYCSVAILVATIGTACALSSC
jgi:hypothetical protein